VKRSTYNQHFLRRFFRHIGFLIRRNRHVQIGLGLGLVGFFILVSIFVSLISAPQRFTDVERFTIPLSASESDIIASLKSKGFIKSPGAFSLILSLRGMHDNITPGGYVLSKSMNAWDVASVLNKKLVMAWVVIPEGLRKEEIADILAKDLHWSNDQKLEWINKDTTTSQDIIEGVYFPDTYLISFTDTPEQVAKRLQSAFNEKFGPLAQEARKKNIKWTTVVTMASLIQREAAGKEDMPIIAGILWNRLEIGMKLDIDATVQYARGNTGKGWWAPISLKDKQIPSSYNTYIYKGLPPHPISNPSLDALSAVVNPATTKCLFYIHDSSRKIHCAATYDEQLNNIERYLR
jgi:UPF0755 protein